MLVRSKIEENTRRAADLLQKIHETLVEEGYHPPNSTLNLVNAAYWWLTGRSLESHDDS